MRIKSDFKGEVYKAKQHGDTLLMPLSAKKEHKKGGNVFTKPP